MSEEAEREHTDKMGEEDKMELSLLMMALDLVASIEVQLCIATYTMMILVYSCDEMPARKHVLRKKVVKCAVEWDNLEAEAELVADRALWIKLRSSVGVCVSHSQEAPNGDRQEGSCQTPREQSCAQEGL